MQQQQIDVNEIQISKTYQQAIKSSQRDEWIMIMKIEIHDIKRKKIYSLIKWSDKKIRILSKKWVYLIKINKNNKILRYKICWIIQSFHQWKDIDYNKIYVSVVADSTIWIIFAVAAVKDWHVWQIDFITVFLNRLLHDNIYMIQSIRFKEENLIYKLNQDLYRLKQSFQIWYETLMKFLQEIDFEKS